MSDSLHVGMVLPFSGPGGQYGPSAQAVTELAIEDINATGGILGRKLSPVWIDGGRPPTVVAHDVRRMLDAGSLDATSGWHTSAIREALAPLAAGSIPYVYPALYEGGETASRVLCTGETPDLQIIPAIRWLRDHKGAQRWGLVGDDYVWPRKTAAVLERQANELGISIEQQWFVPQEQATTTRELTRICDEMKQHRLQGLLILMVGQNAARFNREFSKHLQLSGIVRFCPLMDENTLLASGAKSTKRLFTAGGYFASLTTEDSLDLNERFTRTLGETAPILSTTAESCYEGLLALRALLSQQVSAPISYHGPRGAVSLGSNTQQTIYIAQVHHYDFEILDCIAQ